MDQLLRRTNQRPSRVWSSSSSSRSSRGTSTGGPSVIRGMQPADQPRDHRLVQLVERTLVEQVAQQVGTALAEQVAEAALGQLGP